MIAQNAGAEPGVVLARVESKTGAYGYNAATGEYGDLVKDGVCGLFIADKLGVSQPTASEHLRVLTHAGFLKTKRIKQWTFYKRDEKRIAELRRLFRDAW
jgi:ArsR family transcriptional regulator